MFEYDVPPTRPIPELEPPESTSAPETEEERAKPLGPGQLTSALIDRDINFPATVAYAEKHLEKQEDLAQRKSKSDSALLSKNVISPGDIDIAGEEDEKKKQEETGSMDG